MPKAPLEYDECKVLVQYMNLKGLRFTHIHNEMYTKSWSQKAKAKALGVSSGVPDYMIIIKDKLYFIEMKRLKGGTVSKTQKEWLKALNDCEIESIVCKGADEAIKFINSKL